MKNMLSSIQTIYISIYKVKACNFKSNSEEVRILCACNEISVNQWKDKASCVTFAKLSAYITTLWENHY